MYRGNIYIHQPWKQSLHDKYNRWKLVRVDRNFVFEVVFYISLIPFHFFAWAWNCGYTLITTIIRCHRRRRRRRKRRQWIVKQKQNQLNPHKISHQILLTFDRLPGRPKPIIAGCIQYLLYWIELNLFAHKNAIIQLKSAIVRIYGLIKNKNDYKAYIQLTDKTHHMPNAICTWGINTNTSTL